MSKIGIYQRPDKIKNYSFPTSKPLRSHPLFKEKVWTLQEQIHEKLRKLAEHLESLYPKLSDNYNRNINVVVDNNIEALIKYLDVMQSGFYKNPYTFNTDKLKTNQDCITGMKNVCDTLQSVRSYENEAKKLGKIKHALKELEHLIQPTRLERSLAMTSVKPKKTAAKKEHTQVAAKKKSVTSKKKTAISKKAKPATKVRKPIKKVSKLPKKPAKKVTKTTSKLPVKKKKVVTVKAKPKAKSTVASKKKLKR